MRNRSSSSVSALLLLLSLCLCGSLASELKQVVIGIYAQPSHFEGYSEATKQYVLGANIKWVESVGAKAFIIPFDETNDYYDKIMSGLDGLLFTGGNLNIDLSVPLDHYPSEDGDNLWTKNAAYLISKAVSLNDEGVVFPVWGNCQGFQLMQYVASGFNYTILNHLINDLNVARKVVIHNRVAPVFEGISDEMIRYAFINPVGFYYHELAVTEDDYVYNDKLDDFYEIQAISANSTNIAHTKAFKYAAVIEGKNYPFFGVQFHPEYTLFEANTFGITVPDKAVEFNEFFGKKFAEIANLSSNSYVNNDIVSQELQKELTLVHIESAKFSTITFIDRRSKEHST